MSKVDKNYVDSVMMGTHWIEPHDEHPMGVSAETAGMVERGEAYEPYILPEMDLTGEKSFHEVIDEWIHDLDDLQVVSAMFDFHERWTWDTGTDADMVILEKLEEEFRHRKRKPGDVYYNLNDKCTYAFNGRHWIKMTLSPEEIEESEQLKKSLQTLSGEDVD